MPISSNVALFLVRLPYMALRFWLYEGPTKITSLSWVIVRSTANILSVPILIKTFFAPWKGEYRKGFVAIARGIGIVIRLFTLTVGLAITLIVVALGVLLTICWVAAPIVWVALLIVGLGTSL